MGAVKKLDRPVFFPGLTAWRSSQGPVFDYGEIVPGDPEHGVQGYRLYLSERELREGVIAAGWPLPEKYESALERIQQLVDTLSRAHEHIDQLEVELETARAERVQVVSLAEVLASKKSTATKKPAAKSVA